MEKCSASHRIDDDFATLTCDLEEGHDKSIVYPPEYAHFDILFGIFWRAPEDFSKVRNRVLKNRVEKLALKE